MKCQLCRRDLILDQKRYESIGDIEWVCPVRMIKEGKQKTAYDRVDVSHFRICSDQKHNTRIMFAGGYRIVEQKLPGHPVDNTFNLSKATDNPGPLDFGPYKWITNIPVFDFSDEENLLHKLKLFITFS